MLGVSLLFHAVLFALVLFVPDAGSIRRPPGDQVYQVELVELPSGGDKEPAAQASVPVEAEEAESKPRKAAVQKPKPARRIAEIKREQKPLVVAKRTVDTKPKPVKKEPEASPSELIDKAISRIDREVLSRPQKEKEEPRREKPEQSHLERALAELRSQAGKESRAGGSRPGGGGLTGTLIQIYQSRVHEWIAGNWSYPVALETKGNPEATVLLLVRRDGTITSSRLVKSSSNEVFDESVMRAIERSNPLPPFPEAYRKSHDEIEVRFSLEELGRS